jgi:hypothetical protein
MAVTINIPSQVKTYANLAAFPASGSLKTIYIAEDTNKTYRWDGSTYVEISASAATGLTVGTTPIASGTNGRFLFDDSGVLSETNGAFWDKVNGRFGIGTDTPASKLFLDGGVFTKKYYTNTTNQTINFGSAFELFGTPHSSNGFTFFINPSAWSSGWDLRIGDSSNSILFNRTSGITVNKLNSDELVLGGGSTLSFYRVSPATGFSYNSAGGWNFVLRGSSSENLRVVGSTGNVLINTTTDAGFRLDVNGTARVQTSLEIAGATGLTLGGGASALAYSGSVLNIGNSATWTDVRLYAGGVQKFSQTSSLTTISNTTINLSTATVQLAGVNALTYSGTDIRIGSVAAGFNSLSMYVAGSERARIASTGNLLINTTTDAGFRLDVNGTARVATSILVGPSSTQGTIQTGVFRGTFFNDYANNFTIFQVQTSGNVSFHNSVAIGTTSAPSASKLRVVGLPTSPVGLSAGDVWNNLGILTIV